MRMISKFADSQSGNFAIMTALLAIPLIGAMGLAVDYSAALSNRSVMQDAADSAALATVKAAGLKFSKLSESDKAALIANGKSFFASNEKINAVSVAVTINQAERSVTVTGAYDYPLAFPIFGQSFPMEVLAKAVVGPLRSSYCMIGLSQTASKAISFGGSSDFIGPQCSVHSNSISSSALFQSGGGTAKAKDFCAVGGGAGQFSPKVTSGCDPMEDPYADLPMPAKTGTCLSSNAALGDGDFTLQPGRYCGGLKAPSSANIKLAPGTYVISGGPLDLSSKATLSGDGVTLIFVDDHSYPKVNGGANLNISAPTTGTYAGIAMAARRDISPAKDATIAGGGSVNIEGTVYLPKHNLKITGGGELGIGSDQMALVADTISFTGNSTTTLKMTLNSDFDKAGYKGDRLAKDYSPLLVQ